MGIRSGAPCLAAALVLPLVALSPGASRLLAADMPMPVAKSAATLGQSPEVARLVQDLGAPSFAVREHATRELTSLGVVALPELERAAESVDAEVRARARSILIDVRQADFHDRLEAFASDVDGTHHQSLPGWDQFASLLGTGRQARELFVQMQRAEPDLLLALSKSPKAATEALEGRSAVIAQQATHRNPQDPLTVGTVATMLLLGSSEGVTVGEQIGAQLYPWMIRQNIFELSISKGTISQPLKKLLGRWVVKDANLTTTLENLRFADTYGLRPEALDLATRLLTNDQSRANVRHFALLMVAKFGNRQHLPLVEKMLEDSNSCGSLPAGNPASGSQVDLQVRDIALAVLVHLTNQNLRDYGNLFPQPYPAAPIQVGILVFSEQAQRDAAMKKWTAWRAEHPDA